MNFGSCNLADKLSSFQKKILKKSLNSIDNPYKYLIDVFVEQKLLQQLNLLGLKKSDWKLVRKINLKENECITYARTHVYQWFITLNIAGKSSTRKLLEIPCLNSIGVGIINGLKKIFVIKVKRRNVVFAKYGEWFTLGLTNIRNKRIVLRTNKKGDRKISTKEAIIEFKDFIDDTHSVLLSRDSKMLEELAKVQGVDNLKLSGCDINKNGILDQLFLLLEKVNEIVFDSLHPVNKSWVTLGGYIIDLIERAFYNEENEKLKLENPVDVFDIIWKKLNIKDLNNRINQYLYDGSFTQFLDNLNPIAEIIHTRKISLLYKGLLTRSSSVMELRDLNPYMQGRWCSISTTEGQTIGLIKHLSLAAYIDSSEEILVPYHKVTKGKSEQTVCWLNVYEEIDKYITDFSSFYGPDEIIKARKNNKIFLVSREEINYVMVLSRQTVGLAIAMIHQNNNSEPDRMLMAGNMIRQSLCLKYSESPILRSEISDLLAEWYQEKLGLNDKTKVYLNREKLFLDTEEKKLQNIDTLRKSNSQTVIFLNKNSENNINHLNLKDNTWKFGNNLRVGYMSWEGYSFEDSLVISESVIREEKFTSLHIRELKVPVFKVNNVKEKISRNVINAFKYDLNKLDERGVIKEGMKVRANDILVTKISPRLKKQDSPEHRLLLSILGERNLSFKNDFFRLPPDIEEAVVVSVDFQRGKASKADFQNWIDDKLLSLESEKNILLESLSKKLKLIKDSENFELWKSEIENHYMNKERSLNESMAKEECLFLVKINVLIEKPFNIGDKLTGFHGNKGIVSKIVPDYEMPFDENGRHLEIVISNLSVYGRLNLSQTIESYIGGLHESCIDYLEKNSYSKEAVTKLSSIFGLNVSDINNLIKNRSKESLKFLDFSYDFKGEGLKRMKSLKDLVGFEEMKNLRCGITGDRIDKPVQVGFINFLKLSHTVDSKFSARAIGSYSIKFNQPTRGRMTGNNDIMGSGMSQKIGTMERDALISRGLSNFLHELFTVRSDSIAMRRQVLTGENSDTPVWILLESTRTFIHFLRAMLINMNIIKREGMPLEVKFNMLSQKDIIENSKGRVSQAETIHYRTRKSINNGLFCTKIFGSDKNNSCECEAYVGNKYKGMECPNCKVLVTSNRVRRNFFGHIHFIMPLINTKWATDVAIKNFLPITAAQLQSILKHTGFLALDRKVDSYFFTLQWDWENEYEILSGGLALRYLINKINPKKIYKKKLVQFIRKNGKFELNNEGSILNLMKQFLLSGNDINDLIIDYLPVLPKDLRPLMFTGSGSYISTDLNSLYLQILRRDKRLRELIDFKLIPFMIENAYAKLQESLNELFYQDNMFLSLAGNLKGKQGLIRQHLLSKRVNFSGRTVLILDPNLETGFCGISKKMLKRTFFPLIQKAIVEKGLADDFQEAFIAIKDETVNIDSILSEVCRSNPILLNRNPTLHSLSIQSFFAIPTDHDAIAVNPLTLKAFGGDIDGDAINHYTALNNSSNSELLNKVWEKSLINPSNYEISIKPTREIAVGLWYLSQDFDESLEILDIDDSNFYRILENYSITQPVFYKDRKTSLGRAVIIKLFKNYLKSDDFNTLLPTIDKKWSNSVISDIMKFLDPFKLHPLTISNLLNDLKNLGNRWGTLSGSSFSLEEILVQEKEVEESSKNTVQSLKNFQDQYYTGMLGNFRVFQSLLIKYWEDLENISSYHVKRLLKDTQHDFIIQSGHRGSYDNLQALMFHRGIISFQEGLWTPVFNSLAKGYNEMDFLLLSKVVKKLKDKALGTAKGGYFNRKLIETLREFKIVENDCGTKEGIIITSKNRLDFLGRVDLKGNIVKDISQDKIRSPLTCESEKGVCQKCFGCEPGTNQFPIIGKSIGSLSAYALAEPVTQMLMKTKHNRYFNLQEQSYSIYKAEMSGEIEISDFLGNSISDNNFININGDEQRLFIGNECIKITINNHFITWLQHGDRIISKSNVKLNEDIYWKSEEDLIFSYNKSKITIDKEKMILMLVSVDGSKYYHRFNKFSILKVKDGDTVEKGDLLFSNSKELDEEILESSFDALNEIFQKRQSFSFSKDFHLFAKGNCMVSFKDSKCVILENNSRRSFNMPEQLSHRLVFSNNFIKKGEIIFRGFKGFHPLDLIESGQLDIATDYYMKEVDNIYSSEKIKILKIHLEVLIRELILIGLNTNNEISSLKFLQKNNKSFYPIQRFINNPYPTLEDPISVISYEDVMRNLIRITLNGNIDHLKSINSNIIVGKPAPIEDNYVNLSTDH